MLVLSDNDSQPNDNNWKFCFKFLFLIVFCQEQPRPQEYLDNLDKVQFSSQVYPHLLVLCKRLLNFIGECSFSPP